MHMLQKAGREFEMNWKLIAGILCTYGVLKEFKPIEPYLYRYHQTYMNISAEDLNSKVYPIWTYSYLVFLIPALLLTDLLLYKPILLVESCSYISVWLLLIYGRSIHGQQIAQMLYGCATATEIAYFAYIYVKVDRSKFAKVTVWTRAALQLGRCLAYFGSQLIIMFNVGDLLTLNYISLGSVSLTFVFALLLPFVHWRTVLSTDSVAEEADKIMTANDRKLSEEETTTNEIAQINCTNGTSDEGRARALSTSSSKASRRMGRSSTLDSNANVVPHIAPLPVMIESTGNESPAIPQTYCQFVVHRVKQFRFVVINGLLCQPVVLKWSIWWALSTCGDLQIGNYIQTLWGETQKQMHESKVYNGFVEGAIPLLASVVLLGLQRTRVNWSKWGELCLTFAAFAQAAALLLMATTSSIYVMYFGYAIFRILYQCMITIAQFNIVCEIGVNTCGFIFGANMFIALLFQTLLTLIVVDEHGPLSLTIRPQFYVYSVYHAVIALIFFVVIFRRWVSLMLCGDGNRRSVASYGAAITPASP